MVFSAFFRLIVNAPFARAPFSDRFSFTGIDRGDVNRISGLKIYNSCGQYAF